MLARVVGATLLPSTATTCAANAPALIQNAVAVAPLMMRKRIGPGCTAITSGSDSVRSLAR